MRKALLLAVAATAVAGCAGTLKSTLEAGGTPDYVGSSPAAIAPEQRESQAAQLQAAIEKRLLGNDWGIPLQVGRTAESLVRVRLNADECFETGTATLTPRALLMLSALAEVLRGAPASVTHVLVHGADPGSEPATSLSARRAASVQSDLVARGLPATRVRAEGRGDREPARANAADPANWRVELVVRPVVAGAEAEAWIPPLAEKASP